MVPAGSRARDIHTPVQSLGLMYEKGRGVAQDNAEAMKWYRQSAEQENDHAWYPLGRVLYRAGRY